MLWLRGLHAGFHVMKPAIENRNLYYMVVDLFILNRISWSFHVRGTYTSGV